MTAIDEGKTQGADAADESAAIKRMETERNALPWQARTFGSKRAKSLLILGIVVSALFAGLAVYAAFSARGDQVGPAVAFGLVMLAFCVGFAWYTIYAYRWNRANPDAGAKAENLGWRIQRAQMRRRSWVYLIVFPLVGALFGGLRTRRHNDDATLSDFITGAVVVGVALFIFMAILVTLARRAKREPAP